MTAGSRPFIFSNASCTTASPKKKNPAEAFRASGLINAFCKRSSRQTKAGAAGCRDDGDADAPGESSARRDYTIKGPAANLKSSLHASEFVMGANLPDCAAGSGLRWLFLQGTGIEVHHHLQVNCDAHFAVREAFDADHLADIFAIHGVLGGAERKSYEDAHAFIVVGAACLEKNAIS